MTILLAGKYDGGILAAYDLFVEMETQGEVKPRIQQAKVAPLKRSRGFVGYSGTSKSLVDVAADIDRNNNPVDGIQRFLEMRAADEAVGKAGVATYIFGLSNGHIDLLVRRIESYRAESATHYGAGSGFYPQIAEMFESGYSEGIRESQLRELMTSCIRQAKSINVQTFDRIPLKGLGLVRLDNREFSVLEHAPEF